MPGILSSKIIAEAILSRIDIELEKEGMVFSRYVDDYEVYLYDDNVESIISIFGQTLRRYCFVLNTEKTELVSYPYYIEENFENILEELTFDGMHDVDWVALFNRFFLMEKSGTKGAIRYLLKALSVKPVQTDSSLFKAYLISAIANDNRSLTKACSLLIDINNRYKINQSEEVSDGVARNFLNDEDIKTIKRMLEYHIKSKHELEVIWLLYLLIETDKVESNSYIIQQIAESQNELAHLLILRKDLLNEKLIEEIKNKANSWILLYELYVANHVSEEEFQDRLCVRRNLNTYKNLKNNDIHFCVFE